VIQIIAAPGPKLDATIDTDGLENEFIWGDGGLVVTGILPAARLHLLRAAGG
jgi:hypothetical protein